MGSQLHRHGSMAVEPFREKICRLVSDQVSLRPVLNMLRRSPASGLKSLGYIEAEGTLLYRQRTKKVRGRAC